MSIEVPKQVTPGTNVTLTINAQPKSYVSIMAVDLGVYLLDSTYDVYKKEIVNDLIDEVSFNLLPPSTYPGILSGVVTLTNAHYPYTILSRK